MKNIKKTHGQKVEKKDSLETFFDTTDSKIIYASLPQDLKSLSLEELQILAERLGVLAVDNKVVLIKMLEKERK